MRIERDQVTNNALNSLMDVESLTSYSETDVERQLTYNNLLGLDENVAFRNASTGLQNDNSIMSTQDLNNDEDEVFVLARIGPTLAGMKTTSASKSDGTTTQQQNHGNCTSSPTNYEEIDKFLLPLIDECFGKDHPKENNNNFINNHNHNNNTLSNNIVANGAITSGTTMKTTINLNVNVYFTNSTTTDLSTLEEPNDRYKFTASFQQSLNTKAQVKFDLLDRHQPTSSISCADISEVSLYEDFAELIKFPDGIENAFGTTKTIQSPVDPNKVHYSIQFDGRNIICRTQCGEFVIPRSHYGFAGIKTDRIYAGTTSWPTIQNWQGHPSA